jgi:hypothetical protein
MQSADEFAARLLAESGDDSARMMRMYAIAYGRPPSDGETAANQSFLVEVDRSLAPKEADADKRRRRSWSILCHVVVAANEFIYVK